MAPRKKRCEHRPQGRRWGSTEEARGSAGRRDCRGSTENLQGSAGTARSVRGSLAADGDTPRTLGSTGTAGSVKGSPAADGRADPRERRGSARTVESAGGPHGERRGTSCGGQTRGRRLAAVDGEYEHAPRKILAVLRCNFEQACQGLRNFSPKRAYIGQASSAAIFLSQPPLKMIFGGR
jgi:hypothetical protein